MADLLPTTSVTFRLDGTSFTNPLSMWIFGTTHQDKYCCSMSGIRCSKVVRRSLISASVLKRINTGTPTMFDTTLTPLYTLPASRVRFVSASAGYGIGPTGRYDETNAL